MYKTPFMGVAAANFLAQLHKHEKDAQSVRSVIYAKVVSVVQSSGTGKSHMLTEVSSSSISNHRSRQNRLVGVSLLSPSVFATHAVQVILRQMKMHTTTFELSNQLMT